MWCLKNEMWGSLVAVPLMYFYIFMFAHALLVNFVCRAFEMVFFLCGGLWMFFFIESELYYGCMEILVLLLLLVLLFVV